MPQIQLIVGGIIALVIAVLVATVFWYRGSYIDANAKFEAQQEQTKLALAANEKQQQVIKRITEQRAADDKVLADFTNALNQVTAQSDEVRTSITNLERGNNEVRTYLASRVPSDLAKLLNRSAGSNSARNTRQPATGRANATVQAPARSRH